MHRHPLLRALSIALLLIAMGSSTTRASDPGAPDGGPGFGYSSPTYTPSYGPNLGRGDPGSYGTVIQAPARPKSPTRPDSWPSGDPRTASLPRRDPLGPLPPLSEVKPCEGAQIIAWVGTEVILAGDVLPDVNLVLQQNQDRIPSDQLDMQRQMLMRQRLNALIETKLVYLDAKRTIPADAFPRVTQSLAKTFEDEELKKLMKRHDVTSRRDLELKLRPLGSSVEREKEAFSQRILAQQWVRQQIKLDDEITHHQMLVWYQGHLAEFEHPAKAQWEELTVRIAKYPTKDEASAAIARMGNQVMSGVPLAEVAKAGSDGSTAPDGGRRDWTTKGSLVSEVLDQALFGLPIGQFSPILESQTAFHIIRVTKREEAGRKPFSDVQPEIREKIRQERTKKQLTEYVDRLKQRTPIWTIFDDQPFKSPSGN